MHYALPARRYPVRHLFARIERRLYLHVPRPDIVISLAVPIEVALVRNRTRGKHEPEEYVRRRHSQRPTTAFEGTAGCAIDTGRPLDETVRDLKRVVWKTL
jgi:thymidylate kinase